MSHSIDMLSSELKLQMLKGLTRLNDGLDAGAVEEENEIKISYLIVGSLEIKAIINVHSWGQEGNTNIYWDLLCHGCHCK